MSIIYPYNEILPKKSAHDVFLFNECSALAQLGLDVTLLCGKGAATDSDLYSHYQATTPFTIHSLPLIRKNYLLKMSWNLPFFFLCNRYIHQKRPGYVFLSVLKQAAFHIKHRVKGVRYLYEVHQLNHYSSNHLPVVKHEREVFEQMDQITVTTEALLKILRAPPYSLTVPIEVIPLAVKAQALPPPTFASPFTIAYVGQLYEEQGIFFLLDALAQVPNMELKILGGKKEELESLRRRIEQEPALHDRIHLLGFLPPSLLAQHLKNVHAFVAPFLPIGRMPYVAHTKLYEYAQWGRPFAAPDLPIVREHFSEKEGVVFFEPANISSLVTALKKLPYTSNCSPSSFTWEKRSSHYFKILTS